MHQLTYNDNKLFLQRELQFAQGKEVKCPHIECQRGSNKALCKIEEGAYKKDVGKFNKKNRLWLNNTRCN